MNPKRFFAELKRRNAECPNQAGFFFRSGRGAHARTVSQDNTGNKLVPICIAKQEATATQQQMEIKALIANVREQASLFQKVNDQLEVSKAAPQ